MYNYNYDLENLFFVDDLINSSALISIYEI